MSKTALLILREVIKPSVIVGLVLLALSGNSWSMYDSYDTGSGNKPITLPTAALGDLPGEAITLPTFELTYNYNDISIPGPNGLNMTLSRRHYSNLGFGGPYGSTVGFGKTWYLDIPYIYFKTNVSGSQQTSLGCLGTAGFGRFHMPGRSPLRPVGYGASSDLPSGAILAFEDGEVFLCDSGTAKLRLPGGLTYTYGQSATENSIQFRLITQISDRFGNQITYNYGTVNGKTVVTSISRTDGALITIQYTNVGSGEHRITGATYGSRSISYAYKSVGSYNGVLDKHVDQEGRETSYDYVSSGNYLTGVTFPDGASVQYVHWATPSFFWRLASKTVSGPNILSRSVTYQRVSTASNYGQDPNDPDQLWSKVIEHDYKGTDDLETEYRFKNLAGSSFQYLNGIMALHGQLLSIETSLGGSLKYKQLNEWDFIQHGTIGCTNGIGLYTDRKNCARPRLLKTTHSLYNSGGTDVFVSDSKTYDVYGNPLFSREISSTSAYRYAKQTYLNDKTNWLIGLPLVSSISSNNSTWYEVDRTDYYGSTSSNKSLPHYVYRHGKWVKRFYQYHTTGELKHVTYNGSSRYEKYENYKRGLPQLITVPDRYSSSAVTRQRIVDDYGNLVWEEDFNGNGVTYGYDGLDRLVLEDPDGTIWTPTTWSYNDATSTSTEQTGNRRQVLSKDGLGRAYLTKTEDISDSSTTAYRRQSYDKLGRIAFDSYPSANSSATNGTTYEYDALGRKTLETHSGSSGSRTWNFLNNHRIRFTDEKGYQTTVTYRSYGAPDYDVPTSILQPEGVSTNMAYDLWDQMTSVSQGGMTSQYVYDGYRRLCKVSRPEAGWSYQDYNTADQVTWTANGIGGSSTSCDRNVVPTNTKITSAYDNRSNLKATTFPDSTPDLSIELDDVGNTTKLTHGDRIWDYSYNAINRIELETLSVDGKSFAIDPSYDALGNLSGITYPSGRSVSFTVNGLGQTTAAGGYVTDVDYHPSGAYKTITYGNGVVSRLTQTARQVPEDITLETSLSAMLSDLTYSYDNNLNVTQILDNLSAGYTIDLDYDGIDRLTDADGYWGNGSLTYDTRNNITTKVLGSQSLSYSYNSSNRLSQVTGSVPYTFGYDARGNVTSNGTRSFVYNRADQQVSAGSASYEYDGHNRRVSKTVGGDTSYSIYDQSGTLLYRQKPNGDHVDYVYLGNRLVTTVESR